MINTNKIIQNIIGTQITKNQSFRKRKLRQESEENNIHKNWEKTGNFSMDHFVWENKNKKIFITFHKNIAVEGSPIKYQLEAIKGGYIIELSNDKHCKDFHFKDKKIAFEVIKKIINKNSEISQISEYLYFTSAEQQSSTPFAKL